MFDDCLGNTYKKVQIKRIFLTRNFFKIQSKDPKNSIVLVNFGFTVDSFWFYVITYSIRHISKHIWTAEGKK